VLLLVLLVPLGAMDLVAEARGERDRALAALAAGRQRSAEARAALQERLAEARQKLEEVEVKLVAVRAARGVLAAEAAAAGEAGAGDGGSDLELARRLLDAPAIAADADPAGILSAAATAALRPLDGAASVTVGQQEVFDRRGVLRRVPVIAIGHGQRIAAGEVPDTCGLLRDGGGPAIGGPDLDAAQLAAAARAAAGDLALLPIDPSGLLADRPRPPPWSFRRWFAAGGFFMWPILAIGLTALLVILERCLVLIRHRSRPALSERCFATLAQAGPAPAAALVSARATPQQRLLADGIADLGLPPAEREGRLDARLLAEAGLFERGLGLLAACAAIAPLLGLLGTVSGMIMSFDVLARAGGADPQDLASGIAVALITTQFGLVIAVPIVLIHAVLRRRAQRQLTLLESQAAHLGVWAVPAAEDAAGA
jgi:biopolymer transport protein ExbB